ncbi:CHAT domain-containing protein [Micromonospora sp. DT63]|uniref:CHAT domain-containing protein n=1 Tax=Micromonospora sp. DT63 TaxID=3393441 RepID=UPI003CF6B8FF
MTGSDSLVETIVSAVLSGQHPDSWREAVQKYGPLMRQRSVAEAVLASVGRLAAEGRVVDAERLRRWYDEVDRLIVKQTGMQALLSADDPAEFAAVLRQHPELATPQAVEQGLAEVRSLINSSSPYPSALALRFAGALLPTLMRIADVIDSDELRNRCLSERAALAYVSNDFTGALRDFTVVMEYWTSHRHHFEAGRVASMSGEVLRQLNRDDEALASYRRAVGLLTESGDGEALLGPTHQSIAHLLLDRGDDDGALAHLELAVKHRTNAGQTQRVPALLQALSRLLIHRNETARALEPVERLVEMWAAHPVADGTDMVELILGCAASVVIGSQGEAVYLRSLDGDDPAEYQAYVDAEHLADARRWLAAAERAIRLVPDERAEAMLRHLEAVVHSASGELERAVERAERALRFYTEQDDPSQYYSLLAILIEAEGERGRFEAAIGWCDKMLARPDEDQHRVAALITRSIYLSSLGRTAEALTDLHEAVSSARAIDGKLARTREGSALSALARVYETVGDVRGAVEATRDALRLARSIGHKRGEATELSALGVLLGKLATGSLRVPLSVADRVTILDAMYQADPTLTSWPRGLTLEAAAQALLERAGGIYQEIQDEAGWSSVRLNLSNLVPDSEALRRVDILTEVLARKEATSDLPGAAVALANLAMAYGKLGDRAAASDALGRSLDISRDSGLIELAAQSLVSRAQLRLDGGDAAAAEADLAEAVGMIEAARVQVPLADRYRVGFAHNKGGAYAALTDLLAERGAYDDAFAVAQMSKSRALLEIAATADVQPSQPAVGRFAELLAQEREHLARLRAAQHAVADAVNEDLVAPPADIADLNVVYDEMKAYDPEYVSMRRGTPVGLAELRAWLAAQGRPVLLVEYFLSGDRLTVFLMRAGWTSVVAYRRPLTLEELRVGYADFQRQVVRYRNAGGNGWTALSQVLTEPLAEHLRPGDLVYLVPHRLLHGLPLHALLVGGAPLVARHPVAYAPVSGLLPLSQNAAKGSGRLESCVSIGAVFTEEAQEVAELFGTEAVELTEISPETIAELCADKDVCHFSCHARFNEHYPLSSGLELRPTPGRRRTISDVDGLLTARQIMRMRLNTELVCLSACETAISQVSEGDELLGLIRAFLYAGAPSVTASLWSVDAETTRTLMVAFYRNLRQAWVESGRIDKAEALRQAQLQVMAQVGERSSFYWAPFVLIGDWR